MCLGNGCRIILHGVRHNAQAEQDKLDAQAVRELDRQAHVMACEGAVTVAEAYPKRRPKFASALLPYILACIIE